jgi:hypothetical protein
MSEHYRIIISNLSLFRQESMALKYINEDKTMVSMSRRGSGICSIKIFLIELIKLKNFNDRNINIIYERTETRKGLFYAPGNKCHLLSKKRNYVACDQIGSYVIPFKLSENVDTNNLLCECCFHDIICLTKKMINVEGEKIFQELLSKFILLKYSNIVNDVFKLIINDLIQLYLQ